jgi:hypothetical protein
MRISFGHESRVTELAILESDRRSQWASNGSGKMSWENGVGVRSFDVCEDSRKVVERDGG